MTRKTGIARVTYDAEVTENGRAFIRVRFPTEMFGLQNDGSLTHLEAVLTLEGALSLSGDLISLVRDLENHLLDQGEAQS